MNCLIAWIAAEAEQNFPAADFHCHPQANDSPQRAQRGTGEDVSEDEPQIEDLTTHQFPARSVQGPGIAETDEALSRGAQKLADILREYEEIRSDEENRMQRIYRARTVVMLRRYMKYSIETGRLPSLLGQEFFRAKVTTYSVVTFEDRVIFVHDMERCLERLDEFSRQLIARHILQEHDQMATARLLHCTERTVRRLIPVALDQFCEIMLKAGLIERIESIPEKSCQGGFEGDFSVSDCEQSKNNFQKMSG
jgi:hypothetical protein